MPTTATLLKKLEREKEKKKLESNTPVTAVETSSEAYNNTGHPHTAIELQPGTVQARGEIHRIGLDIVVSTFVIRSRVVTCPSHRASFNGR
jgi:hypothetical protein